ELWRKAAHVLIGTGCLLAGWFVLNYYGPDALDLSFAVVLAGLVLADILIADYGWKLLLYHNLQRKHEVEGLHTATLGFISSIIVYKLFALPVAIAAIAMLIYGDAAAAMASILLKNRKKTDFWRMLAMLVVSTIAGWIVFGWIGVVMGIAATLAECLAAKIDDAITIPVFAGLAGHLLMMVFL
ncbi:MAG: hypothetical protein QXF14_02945, partial [Candidatus Woesearchaeota archaeon]